MLPTADPISPVPRTRRSPWVTALGWLVVVGSGVLVPISTLALLMVLAGNEGSRINDPFEALLILAGPPVTVVAGVGIIRRWRWAHVYVLAGISLYLGWNMKRLIRGPLPTTTTISATGVQTTVMASGSGVSFPGMLIAAGVGVGLLTRGVRREFWPASPTPVEVGGHGTWAGSGVPPTLTPPVGNRAAASTPPSRAGGVAKAQPVASRGAFLGTLAVLVTIGAGMLVWVWMGISSGETRLMVRRAGSRTVMRDKEPVTFWVSTGVGAVLGTGCLGLAGWSVWAVLRERRQGGDQY